VARAIISLSLQNLYIERLESMKALTRKMTLSISTLAVAFGMFFVSVPRANATVYRCTLIGCDATYCYYLCTPISE